MISVVGVFSTVCDFGQRRTFLPTPASRHAARPPAGIGLPSRKQLLHMCAVAGLQALPPVSPSVASGLKYVTSPSGLQWADSKIGAGPPPQMGAKISIDYIMSSTGAARGAKIYSTTDLNLPYTWILGDGSTIKGLELAVAGGDGVPPMLPGGVRRVIITSSTLGYVARDCEEGRGPGPIPPPNQAMGKYQRFKNSFCSSTRPSQPELVLDVKLLD